MLEFLKLIGILLMFPLAAVVAGVLARMDYEEYERGDIPHDRPW